MLASESGADERRDAVVAIAVEDERPEEEMELELLLRRDGASTGSSDSDSSKPICSSPSDADSSSEPLLREHVTGARSRKGARIQKAQPQARKRDGRGKSAHASL